MFSNIFQNWTLSTKMSDKNNKFKNFFLKNVSNLKNFSLNFGPQHPSAHGVLRVIINLTYETINKLDSHIGYLHRGTEKLIEYKNFLKSIPYFDRLDYVSMVNQEHAYCLCIENIIKKPYKNSLLNNNKNNIFKQRIIFDELTRILNHLLAIACHSLDIGNMSPIFWSFEEREKIMGFYENFTGARMHAVMYKPNKININILKKKKLFNILNFCKNFFKTINEIHIILSFNKIWKKRLNNIGNYSFINSILNGLSGVMSRSSGLKTDIRINKLKTYSNYNFIKIKSYLGYKGDSYDRYLIRLNELLESNLIVLLSTIELYKINLNNFFYKKNYLNNKKKSIFFNLMENIIDFFLYWTNNLNLEKNIISSYVESPKGEFSIFLKTDNSNKPFKIKITSPSLKNICFLENIAKGSFIADLVTLIGTIDIVLGEVDR